MFLQGSGGALLAIPFLESLLPSTAWGQTSNAPKRFLTMFGNLDYGHNANWLPGSSGNNAYNIPQPNRIIAAANGERNVYWQPLSEFVPTSTSILAPLYGSALNPYLNKLNILRSLDFAERRGHDTSKLLGGLGSIDDGNGSLPKIPSIDQVINEKIGDTRPVIVCGQTGYDSVSLARTPTGAGRATSVGGYIPDIFNAIFRHGTFPEAGASPTTSRRDVLSRVIGDFSRIMNSRNISALDKVTLSNAMDKMSDVQRGLSTIYASQCSYKGLSVPQKYTWDASTNAQYGKVLADIFAAAFMCDATRVITMGVDMFGDTLEGEILDHQTTSHTPFAAVAAAGGKPEWQIMGERQSYVFKCFLAPLLQALDSAIDPGNGQSILYNSLIYSTVECGQVHGWASQPCLLAGNAGGTISSGNYIDYADRARGGPFEGVDTTDSPSFKLFNKIPGDQYFSNNWHGVLYNRLLVTILQGFGLQPSDYENSNVNKQLLNRTDIGSQNNLSSIGGYGYAFAWDTTINNWGTATFLPELKNYDLAMNRYKLPMP